LPTDIVTATALFSDGDLAPAEAIVRAFLLKHGDHVEGMRLLARIGLAHDVLDDADILLEAVLQLAPDYRAARYDYAIALLRRHKHVQAIAELEKLLQLEPEQSNLPHHLRDRQGGTGRARTALGIYRELVTDAAAGVPIQRAAPVHRALLKALGRQQEAIESYRTAATVRPSLAMPIGASPTSRPIASRRMKFPRMRAEEAAPTTSLVDQYHLCFALGKAFEDRGEFAESFRYYDRGNTLKKSQSSYRPESVERNTRLQKAICTAEFFGARRGYGCADPDPIFIVGLPRSGSTLLEQILASHSQVEGTMELADIPRAVLELQGREPDNENPRYPRILQELRPEDFLRLGRKYLDDTRAYRTDKPFFIDKMPNNFRHLGLIHLILPNAKIIDARRNAMACCFSNFKQLFAAGQEFTYGLENIGRYYRTYAELMAHWDAVLPGKVLRVEHEAVVEDLETNVRRILEFCGLEFEAGCVEFYKTERSIRTASSEQVRQPIFKEGIDQWRNFEPWLGPLKEVLGRDS
jgi:tetratricopeptide (TPR) repeat protein